MRNLKFILPVFLLFFFVGCLSLPKNLTTTYEIENKDNFELLVNKAEQSMKKCFETEDESFTILREDYYNPRYSKIKIIYPTTIGHWPHSYLNVLYLIKKEHKNQIIVKEVELFGLIKNVKKFVSNNMECE